ncbi:hypothetical protein DITRI_Ditri20bG0031500 [Diplodiscus trichospermus]
MERSVMISISILVLGCLAASAASCDTTCNTTEATAYWAEYHAKEINWDMYRADVACASYNGSASLEWRSKYNWTSFCRENITAENSCGLCLNVTYVSPELSGETATATVRIVDICGSPTPTLELDEPVFDQLDIDGCGKFIGHLCVDYEFVDCGDTTIRLYSGQ